MRYKPEQGIFGNLIQLFTELTSTNNNVTINKINADATQNNNEEIFCELDTIDRVAEIEDALCELDEKILVIMEDK